MKFVSRTYCDYNKGMMMKLEESSSLESSAKRLAREKRQRTSHLNRYDIELLELLSKLNFASLTLKQG